MKIKYDFETIKFISLFESLSGSKVKDCFVSNSIIYFVVHKGEMGKALGKKAQNILRTEKLLKKKLIIIEFNPNLFEFVKNVVKPLQLSNIEEKEGVVFLVGKDSHTRGMLIGRAAVNLRTYENIVKRHFPIKEIKVL